MVQGLDQHKSMPNGMTDQTLGRTSTILSGASKMVLSSKQVKDLRFFSVTVTCRMLQLSTIQIGQLFIKAIIFRQNGPLLPGGLQLSKLPNSSSPLCNGLS